MGHNSRPVLLPDHHLCVCATLWYLVRYFTIETIVVCEVI